MKLVKVEQQLDGQRLVFSFTAEARVDFRELVRELASQFHYRIEMRQIGARDEAKLLGGYGTCGRPLCCTTWLEGFDPISFKIAKQQHLSLNPSRVAGLCGRLKYCLRYELPNAKGEHSLDAPTRAVAAARPGLAGAGPAGLAGHDDLRRGSSAGADDCCLGCRGIVKRERPARRVPCIQNS